MKNNIKNFKEFINESYENAGVIALKKVEHLLGIELDVTLDSKKEGTDPSEVAGDYLQCEVIPNPLGETSLEPVIILIYPETKMMQFYHDATPYPTNRKQRNNMRTMSMLLNEEPVPIDSVTKKDYEWFIDRLMQELEDY